MSSWDAMWSWASAVVAVPPSWLLLAALVLGAAIASAPLTWRFSRLFATYVHEAGHAVIAVVTGRRVTRIRLEADTSGTTEHIGRPGLGRLLTAFAGYPAPALVGFGFAAGVAAGRPSLAVLGLFLVCVGLLFVQRSWRGFLMSVFIGGGLYLVAQFSGWWASMLLAVLAGYLLAASPRTVLELHFSRRRHRAAGLPVHSDADALAEQTGLPAGIWEAVFLLVCALCVWGSVAQLLV